jgi:hypothetical protein
VKSHQLRDEINNGKTISPDILEKYEVHVVASVLKLYLLELPDPVVSHQAYEIIKTIYSTPATEADESTRIQIIQNTLGNLRLANIATLDALTTHFTLLIELTSADDVYIAALATNLAPCIMRPKHETPLSMDERFAVRLLRDLFAHRESIFGELKRASSIRAREQAAATAAATSSSTIGGGARGRGPSIVADDHGRSRRELEQERAAAIAASSRARSPAPGTDRGSARRDRSAHRHRGSVDTRFPIAVHSTGSPTENRRATVTRHSLEVPGQEGVASTVENETKANGSATHTAAPAPAATVVPPPTSHVHTGVELSDKPMDD